MHMRWCQRQRPWQGDTCARPHWVSWHADYPFKAPAVRFETACFHPNVDQHGNICLDILKEKWSAAYR